MRSSLAHNAYKVYFYVLFNSLLRTSQFAGLPLSIFFKDKSAFWSSMFRNTLSAIFLLTGIKIRIYNHNKTMPEKVVFCSNHQGPLDGPIYEVVMKGRSFALTQPFDLFPNVLKFWVRGIKCVPVFRDDKERKLCKEGLDHKRAIRKAVEELKKDEDSLMVFPEGHIEHKYHYLHFHTGTERIALEAGVNIVPCKIEHSYRLSSPNRKDVHPGIVDVIIGDVWDISKYYGKQENHRLVRKLTKELEFKIKHLEKPYHNHFRRAETRFYRKAKFGEDITL